MEGLITLFPLTNFKNIQTRWKETIPLYSPPSLNFQTGHKHHILPPWFVLHPPFFTVSIAIFVQLENEINMNMQYTLVWAQTQLGLSFCWVGSVFQPPATRPGFPGIKLTQFEDFGPWSGRVLSWSWISFCIFFCPCYLKKKINKY